MPTAGIIAEYNPFHDGHAFHIAKTREALGPNCSVVAVMSATAAQRGEFCMLSAHARAEMAVSCGVDLVLALHAPFSCASAERFAQAAVATLDACGVVDTLSFGSEAGNISTLSKLAQLLDSVALKRLLDSFLSGGLSFPKARQLAAEQLAGHKLPELVQPNNILAIEYIRAIDRLGARLEPFTIKRSGLAHDARLGSGFPSALSLREAFRRGENISLPRGAALILQRELEAGRFTDSDGLRQLELCMLARLKTMSADELKALPDATEGIDNRFQRAIRSASSMDELRAMLKTKRYAYSRLSRMLLCSYIGVNAALAKLSPPLLHVLCFNEQGRKLLAQMRKTASLPVVVKPAAAKRLNTDVLTVLESECRAADLQALSFSAPAQRGGGRLWLHSPTLLSSS